MQAILDHAATLVIDGASWEPGSWTTARCELWHRMNPQQQAWLFNWIEKEKELGVCHDRQLPRAPQRNHTAAE